MPAPPRILVILPSIPIQGMEWSSLQICRMLRQRGAEVRIVTERTHGHRIRREAERAGLSDCVECEDHGRRRLVP